MALGGLCWVPVLWSTEAPWMGDQPNLHPPAPPTRSHPTAWAAYAACALAWLSAVPSFYWALGGTAGLDTVGGAIEQLARTRDPAGIALGLGAGVLKVAGGLLALALVRPGGPRHPSPAAGRRRLDRQCGADLLWRPAGGGGGLGVGQADQPLRSHRPDRAAMARFSVGPVVPGLGSPARRGCLAVRSGIPPSGDTMNQSAMASRLRDSRMRRGLQQLSRSTLRRYEPNF
jgi:hypothetical protein